MKMFKRFAAALLAGVMVLAMLTACGGGGSGSPIAPGSDVEKAETFYMEVFNAMLGKEYPNDAKLKEEAKKVLDASLNADGTLKDGKKMTVTLGSDTAITILPSQGSNTVPAGFTSEELAQAIAQKDQAIAAVKGQFGGIMDQVTVTKLAVGAVQRGDKTYVALAMTVDMPKQ